MSGGFIILTFHRVTAETSTLMFFFFVIASNEICVARGLNVIGLRNGVQVSRVINVEFLLNLAINSQEFQNQN